MGNMAYYTPGGDIDTFSEIMQYRSLQHFHHERALKYKRKAAAAAGKPYQPMLAGISRWHSDYATLLSEHIERMEASNEVSPLQ